MSCRRKQKHTTTLEIGVVPVIMGLSFLVFLREDLPAEIVAIIVLLTLFLNKKTKDTNQYFQF